MFTLPRTLNDCVLAILVAGWLAACSDSDKTYGLEFVLANQIRDIESVLAENRRPVAVGIPGYILPTDVDAKLFLNYAASVSGVNVEPAGAITVTEESPTKSCWKSYTLRAASLGRARVTVNYADGTLQTIHYALIKPAAQAVADMGAFLTTGQFQEMELNVDTRELRVALAPADSHTRMARLRVEQPAQVPGIGSYAIVGSFSREREASVIPLATGPTWVALSGQ